MDKIKFWLLKYRDEYKNVKSPRDGELPPLSNYVTTEDKFVDLYELLDELSRSHRFEPYCKEQLEIYTLIIIDGLKLEEWFSTIESFYYEELIHFSVNYLNYLGNGKEYHLNVFSHLSKEMELFIDRDDFKNTISLSNILTEIISSAEFE